MEDQTKKWLERLVLILLIVLIGTLAVNQALEFHYKAVFLKTPCQLCRDLNPDVANCLTREGTITQFWNYTGGWSP